MASVSLLYSAAAKAVVERWPWFVRLKIFPKFPPGRTVIRGQ